MKMRVVDSSLVVGTDEKGVPYTNVQGTMMKPMSWGFFQSPGQ